METKAFGRIYLYLYQMNKKTPPENRGRFREDEVFFTQT